jgi:sarcosine oxidase, subunit beta
MAETPMRGGWAGAITLTEDGKPVLDRHPTVDGLFVFTGDNGSSFKTAPAIGVCPGRVDRRWPRQLDRPAAFPDAALRRREPLVGEHEYGDRDTEYSRARGVMLG